MGVGANAPAPILLRRKNIMKRILASVLTAVVLTGCSSTNNITKENIEKHDVSPDSVHMIQSEKIGISSLNHDRIIELLNKQVNFRVADEIIINIPDSAPVLEFTTKTLDNNYDLLQDFNFNSLYSGFKEMYSYYFPDRDFDENYLYYTGNNSVEEWDDSGNQISFLHKVKDDLNILKSDEGDSVGLIYDEGIGKENKNGCIEFNCYPDLNIGGIGIINRNNYDFYSYKKTAFLPPNSNQSFLLEDKDVSISEAVKYFEDKINKAPYPQNKNCTLRVAAVNVLDMGNGKFCYNMLCSYDINGILTEFSYGEINSRKISKYGSQVSSYGYMMKSDEIEMLQLCNPFIIMEDIKQYESISAFEDAISLISSKLTNEVEFEVQRAELVYCYQPVKTNSGYYDINGYPSKVYPVWKLTLFNPNDLYTYLCYVSADGTDFDYSVITY